MKIEISKSQYTQIQDEIIHLEEKREDSMDKLDVWDMIDITDAIQILKQIIDSEEIDLNKLQLNQ